MQIRISRNFLLQDSGKILRKDNDVEETETRELLLHFAGTPLNWSGACKADNSLSLK